MYRLPHQFQAGLQDPGRGTEKTTLVQPVCLGRLLGQEYWVAQGTDKERVPWEEYAPYRQRSGPEDGVPPSTSLWLAVFPWGSVLLPALAPMQ